MAIFFNGWIGYGTAVQAGVLTEPADQAYARRPFVLGDLDSGIVADVGGGTVGPASTAWGSLGFAGLFDAQAAGNLLLWFALRSPVTVKAGGTITSGGGGGVGGHRFYFPDLQAYPLRSHLWPAGSVVASTSEGRLLTAGVALQASGGLLSAQTPVFGTGVVMASLPAAQPATGSGQLWNNGGIISIA